MCVIVRVGVVVLWCVRVCVWVLGVQDYEDYYYGQ